MAKVTSPNPDYDGVSIGLQFSQGVGETDDAKKIEWFQEHGYLVEIGSAAPTSSAVQDSEFASEFSNSAQESTEGFVNAFSSNAANETEFASEAGTSNFQESSDSESHGHSKKHKR